MSWSSGNIFKLLKLVSSESNRWYRGGLSVSPDLRGHCICVDWQISHFYSTLIVLHRLLPETSSLLEFIRRRACVHNLKLSIVILQFFWKLVLSFTPYIMRYLTSTPFLFFFPLEIAGWRKKYSWNHKRIQPCNHQAYIVNKTRIFNYSSIAKTKYWQGGSNLFLRISPDT